MPWDFSTEPEFQEVGLGQRIRTRASVAARHPLNPHRQFHPLDDELRPIVDPMKQAVRDAGCGPPTSGPNLVASATGRSSSPCSTRSWVCRSGRPSSSGPRPPTPAMPRSSPTTAPTSRRRSTCSRCSTARCFSSYSMTEPQAGSDPQQFTTRRSRTATSGSSTGGSTSPPMPAPRRSSL